MSISLEQTLRTRVFALLLLFACVTNAAAETLWYRIEVLAFRQYEGTNEKTLRPPVRIPDNARLLLHEPVPPQALGQLELFQPPPEVRTSDDDGLGRWIDALEDRALALGMDARLAEIAEWEPPVRKPAANSAPTVDPLVAAEIAEAERLERARKAKIAESRAYSMPSAWAYRALPRFALQLRNAAAKLDGRDGYGVLLHRSWLQPTKTNERGEPVLLHSDRTAARALAQLSATEVPQLTLSVWLPATAVAGADAEEKAARNLRTQLRLRGSVRAASGRLFYLDGPGIGALVRVDFVNRDVAEQLLGL